MLCYQKIAAERIAIIRSWTRSKEAILNCLEAAVQSHAFLNISKENAGDRVFHLEKLQADSLEQPFYTKMTWPRTFS